VESYRKGDNLMGVMGTGALKPLLQKLGAISLTVHPSLFDMPGKQG
jgi:hypothetical protein